ncbi:hypothetical protein P152DRAFT_48423 [Eremomyces bilateralis CBS 781.70]|uniref:Uncharacterized protein n=1 Tax=Eremomyces bilateralis CBS 781.70 TaxID=1392243 RepID=A0A6G1G0N7_9PEZI|nr:uncharacterized protein P152DRAFT_48423 [Eremomyces bilateralis CBS 781.70]KAF1811675.1 hypothetical protein P152DRAFT_48423 [Eremomyces bilateralis CBS 781.70]
MSYRASSTLLTFLGDPINTGHSPSISSASHIPFVSTFQTPNGQPGHAQRPPETSLHHGRHPHASTPHPPSPAPTSIPLSTATRTRSLATWFPHSTSKFSSHTFAACPPTVISMPGTGMPSAWSRWSSCFSSGEMERGSVSGDGGGLEGGVSVEGEGGRRGRAIGVIAEEPNWDSRRRRRRERRVEEEVGVDGWDVEVGAWEWEWA